MARSGYKLTRGAPGREKEADSLREFHAWDCVRLVPAASLFRVKGRLRKQKGHLSVREPSPLNGHRWTNPVPCRMPMAACGRGRVKTENRKVLKGRFTIADTRRSRCRPFSQAGFDSARMKRTF
jgi:hypothetical protein